MGGHVLVTKICGPESCKDYTHTFGFSKTLRKIMGFNIVQDETSPDSWSGDTKRSQHPAALSNAIPSVLFVYTDLCESHVTGDVQTPLLRVVPVDIDKYEYGSMRLRTFASPKYVNLLKLNFDTIEIDIRDELGNNVPFDHGTLTVTLHFKRLD